MKRSTVQILVVVAIIQIQSLKTEVEKGSMSTAIVHGLVDPKEQEKSIIDRHIMLYCIRCLVPKGNQVNIPEPGSGYLVATQTKPGTVGRIPTRVFFSC